MLFPSSHNNFPKYFSLPINPTLLSLHLASQFYSLSFSSPTLRFYFILSSSFFCQLSSFPLSFHFHISPNDYSISHLLPCLPTPIAPTIVSSLPVTHHIIPFPGLPLRLPFFLYLLSSSCPTSVPYFSLFFHILSIPSSRFCHPFVLLFSHICQTTVISSSLLPCQPLHFLCRDSCLLVLPHPAFVYLLHYYYSLSTPCFLRTLHVPYSSLSLYRPLPSCFPHS